MPGRLREVPGVMQCCTMDERVRREVIIGRERERESDWILIEFAAVDSFGEFDSFRLANNDMCRRES